MAAMGSRSYNGGWQVSISTTVQPTLLIVSGREGWRGGGAGERQGREEEECRGLECQPDSDGTMHTPGTHDNTVKSIS